jgi:hypothetical protein
VSPAILIATAAGLLLLGVFVVVERRSRDPLVPPGLLANHAVSMAVVIALMFMATFGSLLYFLSIYFQDVLGLDALETGIAFLLPTAVVVAGSSLASGGDTLRHQTHPGRSSYARRNRRCRGGSRDVVGEHVRDDHTRSDRREHR